MEMDRQIDGSFIKEYLKYTRGQESPEMFHIWVALSMIASALDRDVYMDRGYFDLYPNLFVVLVAGTARCHKSAAIKMGVNGILKEIDDPPKIFAQKITNERLIQFLAEPKADVVDLSEDEESESDGDHISFKSTGLIAAEELSSFLGTSAMERGIITTLTDLYGSPDEWKYETKTSGTNELQNVYVNLLGASTGKWLRSAIPQEAIGGGFISRTIFVYQDKPGRHVPHPELSMPDDMGVLEERLIHDLNIINKLEGEMEWTDKARGWYSEWDKKHIEESYTDFDSDFFTRYRHIIIKVAMLISVSESNELTLKVPHLEQAQAYLDAVKSKMSPVISTMTTEESELPTQKVLGVIKRRGTITNQKLVKYTKRFCKSDGLQQIINTLQESGQIEMTVNEDGMTKYAYTGEE